MAAVMSTNNDEYSDEKRYEKMKEIIYAISSYAYRGAGHPEDLEELTNDYTKAVTDFYAYLTGGASLSETQYRELKDMI